MDHRRYRPPFWKSKDRGPNGRRLCRQCGTEVPKGRQTWCSKACVDHYTDRTPAGFRKAVLDASDGRCALCGWDVRWLIARYDRILRRQSRLVGRWFDREQAALRRALRHPGRRHRPRSYPRRWLGSWLRGWLARRGVDLSRSLLEADHTVPLIEGGDFGTANGRALCRPCHKAQTADLAKRRAVGRTRPRRVRSWGAGQGGRSNP